MAIEPKADTTSEYNNGSKDVLPPADTDRSDE